MTRTAWRRLAEYTTLTGALRRADLPEGWPADDDILDELRRFNPDLIARGDYRLVLLALQRCLDRGPRVTVAEVAAELGDDARCWLRGVSRPLILTCAFSLMCPATRTGVTLVKVPVACVTSVTTGGMVSTVKRDSTSGEACPKMSVTRSDR